MSKPTKREQLVRVAEVLANVGASPDLYDFVLGEVAKIDKRKNAPRALTPTQRENVALKQTLYGLVANSEEPIRAGELAKQADISVQRASALLRQLVTSGLVERVTEGKVTTFRVKG